MNTDKREDFLAVLLVAWMFCTAPFPVWAEIEMVPIAIMTLCRASRTTGAVALEVRKF